MDFLPSAKDPETGALVPNQRDKAGSAALNLLFYFPNTL